MVGGIGEEIKSDSSDLEDLRTKLNEIIVVKLNVIHYPLVWDVFT